MKRHFFPFLLLVSLAFAKEKTTLYVLCYHSFLTNVSSPYNFPPEVFRSHLQKLKENGYSFVSWQQITNTKLKGRKNILITIDDGNISIRNVEAILDEFGIRGILFIYPAIIGRVHYALHYDDLIRFQNKGWAIGAHGYNHLFVNQKLYENDPRSFFREIHYSKQILEKKLNTSITLFGYPFGIYSPITITNLKQNTYTHAFTLIAKPTQWPPDDTYQIPRYLMTSQMWSYLTQLLFSTKYIVHH